MESNYRNRDFEEFVKQNADQYRMFPSEKVWKNIHGTLHTRRKWYGFGLAMLLLLTGTAVTWVMISYPVSKNTTAAFAKSISSPEAKEPFSVSKSAALHDEPQPQVTALPFTTAAYATKSTTVVETAITDPELATAGFLQEDRGTVSFLVDQLPAIKTERSPSAIGNIIARPAIAVNLPLFTEHETILQSLATEKTAVVEKPAIVAAVPAPPQLNDGYPLTIESVTNAFQHKSSKKINWQLFVTPTISYRKLDENKTFDNPVGLSYPFASLRDVNKAVTHKPDMGLQLGLSAGYPVTKNLTIRGGLQFNINRYDIKAFPYNPEIATINLSAPNGISAVSAWTPYRNYGGFKSDWLKNFYFSVSAPIGIELKLFGNQKTNFGIATTLQPTYIIKDRAYLISTDYKNYAEVPWLIRHVNVNTGFETFVNYTNGKTRWQIGPQVRYQVLSSFHNKYPVKENLFDFGIKVGVSLNQ